MLRFFYVGIAMIVIRQLSSRSANNEIYFYE